MTSRKTKIEKYQSAEMAIRITIPCLTFITSVMNFISTDVVTNINAKKYILLSISIIGLATSVPLTLALEIIRNKITNETTKARDIVIHPDEDTIGDGPYTLQSPILEPKKYGFLRDLVPFKNKWN